MVYWLVKDGRTDLKSVYTLCTFTVFQLYFCYLIVDRLHLTESEHQPLAVLGIETCFICSPCSEVFGLWCLEWSVLPCSWSLFNKDKKYHKQRRVTCEIVPCFYFSLSETLKLSSFVKSTQFWQCLTSKWIFSTVKECILMLHTFTRGRTVV